MVFCFRLPKQSVPITITVVSSNPTQAEYAHYVIKFNLSLATGRLFSPGTPVSVTNKTYLQDITQLLLKVALNTLTLSL